MNYCTFFIISDKLKVYCNVCKKKTEFQLLFDLLTVLSKDPILSNQSLFPLIIIVFFLNDYTASENWMVTE